MKRTMLVREPVKSAAHAASSNVFSSVKLSRLQEYKDERVKEIYLMLDSAEVANASQGDMTDKLLTAVSDVKLVCQGILEIDGFSGTELGYANRICEPADAWYDYNFRGVNNDGTSGDFMIPLFRASDSLSQKDGFPAAALADGTFSMTTGADADALVDGSTNTSFSGTWRLLFVTEKASNITLCPPYILKRQSIGESATYQFPHNRREITTCAGAYSAEGFTLSQEDEITVDGRLVYERGTQLSQLQDYRDLSSHLHTVNRLRNQEVADAGATSFSNANVVIYRPETRQGDALQGELAVTPGAARTSLYVTRGRMTAAVVELYAQRLKKEIDTTQLEIVGENNERLAYDPQAVFPVYSGQKA